MKVKKPPNIATLSVLLLLFAWLPFQAFGSDIRVGAALGYGGTGIDSAIMLNGAETIAKRSEGPGVLTFFADRLFSDTLALGVEHSRGFSLGPFSTGESFTGLTGRWYFMGPAPSVSQKAEDGATLLVKRYTFFAGLATGVAQASISRDGDQIPNVSGSGVYFGVKFGADYPMAPGIGIRPEIIYNTTILNNDPLPSTLLEFSIQLGLYYYL